MKAARPTWRERLEDSAAVLLVGLFLPGLVRLWIALQLVRDDLERDTRRAREAG